MKKIISIVLMMVLLCGCLSIAAGAESSKIDHTLAAELETLAEGETVAVVVWTEIPGNFKSSFELTEYVDRLTYEECGLTAGMCTTMEQVDAYSKVYNRILFELEKAYIPVVIEKLGLGDEDIISYGCNTLIVCLTKEEIAAAAAMDEVTFIDRYDGAPPVEPIEDDPFELLDPYQIDPHDLKAKFAEWLFSIGRIGEYDPEDIPELITLLRDYRVIYPGNHMALIYEDWSEICPWLQEYDLEICGRVIPGITGASDESNAYPYFVYDKLSGVFKNVYDISPEDDCYTELKKALDELKIGRPIGDADGDGLLDILDATLIQRALVGLDIVLEDADRYWCGGMDGAWKRYSDADGDGSITILDATRIQRTLAGLSEIEPAK